MGDAGQLRANIEIKARCADPAATRARARSLATEVVGIDHQVDTYFRTHRGRLKLRESSLSQAQLVPYLRADTRGPKRSDYRVIPVEDPAGLKALLSEILGVHAIVDKRREILLCDNVRTHLDSVSGLGSFVELEAVFDGAAGAEPEERRKVDRLMQQLGVGEEDLLAHSYEQLIAGARAR